MRLRRRTDAWERAIDECAARGDAHGIVRILACHVFPLEVFFSSELAQLRTFSIPTISSRLAATGEYTRRAARRLDDTKAILSEIIVPGPQSRAGSEMIEHLNWIHGHYRIANEDYLYTLATLVLEPVEWIGRFGWRPLRRKERDALFAMYMQLGEKMRIQRLPSSYEELERDARAYEARARRYAESNELVARGLLRAIAAQLPAPARPWLEPAVAALLGGETRRALGLCEPSFTVRATLGGVARGRRRLGRHVTVWDDVAFWDTALFRALPTYPGGYQRMRLGPDKLLARRDERAAGRGRRADPTPRVEDPTPGR